jgi:hypothetical protein
MVTHVSLAVSSLCWLERMDFQSLMLSYIIHVHLDGPYVLSTFKFVTQSSLITKQLCLDTVLKPPSRSFTFQFLYVNPPPVRSI